MNKVKYYRLISGLLLKDLSEKTELSVGHLSHIENGNKQPSKSAMESIALAVTVKRIAYWKDYTFYKRLPQSRIQ